MNVLFPALRDASPTPALRFGDRTLSYRQLASVAGAVAERIAGETRIAVWATPTLETAVGVVGALLAGVAVVPLNPKVGAYELTHIVTDSAPSLILAEPGDDLPGPLAALPRVDIETAQPPEDAEPGPLPNEPGDEAPALIVYTSGTTGPPKGVVLPGAPLRTPSTPWRTPGSGPPTTSSSTPCRSSMYTA